MTSRKVIITGGSRSIGAECVRAFAKSGDKVVFIYKNSDDAAAALSMETSATSIKADISVRKEAFEAIETAKEMLGGVDVLVNNAGVSHIGLFSDMSEEEYRFIMGTNFDAAIYCAQAVISDMIRQKSGKIINISSMWGEVGASCEVVYSASKAALIGFTKALAKELGPSNINVNCITPGVIDTQMNKDLDNEILRQLSDETPLSRLGKPAEIADAVMFLASDASSFITGQIIGVNGGIVM